MEKYRTFWPRFAALMIDNFIMLPLVILEDWFRQAEFAVGFFYFWIPFAASIPIIYRVFSHWKYGQTLGKMAMYVKVVDAASEGEIGLSHALRREIPQLIFSAFAVYVAIAFFGVDPEAQELKSPLSLLGSFAMIWSLADIAVFFGNEKRRALHDLIAGTSVVRVPKEIED